LSHGFVATVDGAAEDLPINRRFFPGGDNSIRGYQYGEAAPRDEFNALVGAETYTLANIEFEQGITPKWSFVFFFDALGEATRIADWPIDESLFSARSWNTVEEPDRPGPAGIRT
jgi:outer membrane translocation and assembly module TamA